MGVECDRCGRVLSSAAKLKSHQEKSLPCDLKCRTCEKAFSDRHQYYHHQVSTHPDTRRRRHGNNTSLREIADTAASQNAIVPAADSVNRANTVYLPTSAPVSHLIPIDDFKILSDYATSVEQASVMRSTDDNSFKVAVVTEYTFRAQELREMIGDELLALVFRTFDFIPGISNPSRLIELLKTLLMRVHAGKNDRLHAICIGDVSRLTVNVFSRDTPLAKGYWQLNSKKLATRRIQQHAKTVYEFIARASAASLTQVFVKQSGKVGLSLRAGDNRVLVITDDSGGISANKKERLNRHQISQLHRQHNLPDVPENHVVISELHDTDVIQFDTAKNKLSPNMLQDANDKFKALREAVNGKRDAMINFVNELDITPEDCDEFLHNSYHTCLKTYRTIEDQDRD